MTGNELRQSFLEFFEGKGHLIHPSSSLIPDDPTTLLTSAGMQPFVPYFMGQEEPPCRRMTTCQKSCRADDIDEVGRTWRHCTFFEMLGNFSFGDYFKKEAIEWAWEYVTEVLQIPREVLWFSVYQDDEEAYELWHNHVGVPTKRILRFGKQDNWWGPVGSTGPCGPDSEIFLDRGPEFGCHRPDCRPGCDCDRYGELWNLVFQQYDQQENGELIPLPRPGIDTGMGFERVAAVLQGKKTIFESDLFQPLLDRIEDLVRAGNGSFAGYGSSQETDVAMRIIADHVRAVVFMMTDGIRPSNEGRGYVQRRFLRRAARYGRSLGIEEPFLYRMLPTIIGVMGEAYPELAENQATTEQYLRVEEERFQETLEQGLVLLEQVLDEVASTGGTQVAGEQVFRLYDTYGFPAELTAEIAGERGLGVDLAGFEERLEAQRQRARAAGGFAQSWQTEGLHAKEKSRFLGYETCRAQGTVLSVYDLDGNKGVVLDRTPFYAEAGGQVGDTGVLLHGDEELPVMNTVKSHEAIVHYVPRRPAWLQPGATVTAAVDEPRRAAIRRAHSATHLLQAALRAVLGDHVTQSGSLVEPDRLRFDFSHFQRLTDAELAEVERLVNEAVVRNLPVGVRETTLAEAKAAGAMALFGEKYGARVRLVEMGEVSRELCGGTHVTETGEIGVCKLVRESSVGSNLRRIEALTGPAAVDYLNEREQVLRELAARLGTTPERVPQAVEKLQQALKAAEKEIQTLIRRGTAGGGATEATTVDVGGIKVLVARVDEVRAEALRSAADQLLGSTDPGVAVCGGVSGGKVLFAAKASPAALARGAHMGNLLRQVAAVAGGGGGGRPDFAQAGGKDPAKLAEALEQVPALVQGQMG